MYILTMTENYISHFINQCDLACAELNIARTTLSRRIFKNNNKIDELANGANVTFRVLEAAKSRLSAQLAQAVAKDPIS